MQQIDCINNKANTPNSLETLEALEAVRKVKELKAELKILANALDGTPLMYPCSKLFEPEGWCKEHCKKFGPTAECWLKYAEMMLEGKK